MIGRRKVLALTAGSLALGSRGLIAAGGDPAGPAGDLRLIRRGIPSSGELLPVMGMGTSRTFDVPGDAEALANLTRVTEAFFAGGGTVIDSSPMYGEAESRLGDVFRQLPQRPAVFEATKVWTTGRESGIAQMQASAERVGVDHFDLIAVHNLQDWETHLETLRQWKLEGKVRYIGITTSHGRYRAELLEVMRTVPLDFVQFSYNIEDRSAEEDILPLALERGIAAMVNRPYQRGSLFARSRKRELPALAADIDCASWGQFYLKFIIGHPAVTSVIPATAKVHHMVDNMKANFGRVPDPQQRAEMLRIFTNL